MDSLLSWFMLLCVACAAGAWFFKRVITELEQKRRACDEWYNRMGW